MDAEHKPSYVVLIISTAVVFVGCIIVNSLAATGLDTALFNNKTGDVSDYYYLEITPAGWTFSIWAVIYLWQAAWLAYALSTICRRCSYGYLYLIPGHLTPRFYLAYIPNFLFNVIWLVLWDRFLPQYALIPIALTAVSLFVALGISYSALYRCGAVLMREEMKKEIWVTRCLVQNGIACYATWVSIATLLNFSVVLAYNGEVSQTISSTVALCFLLLELIVWFCLDNFVLDTFVRYTITPYFVFIVALAGSIDKNWDLTKNNSALSAFILATACCGTVFKLCLMIWRHLNRPVYSELYFYRQPSVVYGALEQNEKLIM